MLTFKATALPIMLGLSLPVLAPGALRAEVTAKGAPTTGSSVAAPSGSGVSLQLAHERFTLDNGLEVILHPDPRIPLVAVSVWYHVGNGDEVPGKSGFAHLFEHMMFQGSKHAGEDSHFRVLRSIGGDGINGSTNPDRTNYHEVVPRQHLETALWLESDRMGYMLDLLTEKSLDNQRSVVRNERRQRIDNVPYGQEMLAVAETLYPEGHPYRYLTIGRHEDLAAASLEDTRAFFRHWYRPSNATLTLAGDFDPAQARKLVEKWFGTFPKLAKPTRVLAPTPALEKTVRKQVDDPFARLRRIRYSWHSTRFLAPGDAELDILADVLAANGWGRLYKRLVLDSQLAQSVAAYQYSAEVAGSFSIIVDLKPGADQALVEAAIVDEVGRVLREPVGAAEIARSVRRLEANTIWELESLLSRAERLQWMNHYTKDTNYLPKHLEVYRSRTAADLTRVAKLVLDRPRLEMITIPVEKAK